MGKCSMHKGLSSENQKFLTSNIQPVGFNMDSPLTTPLSATSATQCEKLFGEYYDPGPILDDKIFPPSILDRPYQDMKGNIFPQKYPTLHSDEDPIELKCETSDTINYSPNNNIDSKFTTGMISQPDNDVIRANLHDSFGLNEGPPIDNARGIGRKGYSENVHDWFYDGGSEALLEYDHITRGTTRDGCNMSGELCKMFNGKNRLNPNANPITESPATLPFLYSKDSCNIDVISKVLASENFMGEEDMYRGTVTAEPHVKISANGVQDHVEEATYEFRAGNNAARNGFASLFSKNYVNTDYGSARKSPVIPDTVSSLLQDDDGDFNISICQALNNKNDQPQKMSPPFARPSPGIVDSVIDPLKSMNLGRFNSQDRRGSLKYNALKLDTSNINEPWSTFERDWGRVTSPLNGRYGGGYYSRALEFGYPLIDQNRLRKPCRYGNILPPSAGILESERVQSFSILDLDRSNIKKYQNFYENSHRYDDLKPRCRRKSKIDLADEMNIRSRIKTSSEKVPKSAFLSPIMTQGNDYTCLSCFSHYPEMGLKTALPYRQPRDRLPSRPHCTTEVHLTGEHCCEDSSSHYRLNKRFSACGAESGKYYSGRCSADHSRQNCDSPNSACDAYHWDNESRNRCSCKYLQKESRKNAHLEEIRTNNKCTKLELRHALGNIVAFSEDQHGSRFIQRKLQTATIQEKQAAFNEISNHALQLMMGVFGNYVIQKFFEHGTQQQKQILVKKMEGHVLYLSLQIYGCRVVQKALEYVSPDEQTSLIKELDGSIIKCIKDQNGNHVIQKAIEIIPADRIKFIIDILIEQLIDLATHPYGCRVVQRVIQRFYDEKDDGENFSDFNSEEAEERTCSSNIWNSQRKLVLDEIQKYVTNLIQDQYGNYVVQHILERGGPHEKSLIMKKVSGQVLQLSRHKFASNVVEKCVAYGSVKDRKLLIDEVMRVRPDGTYPLVTMMKDQFANYVVQRMLDTAEEEQRNAFVASIKPHLQFLKKYNYGRNLIAKVEKLLAAQNTSDQI